jgi:hypothetical protein
MDLNIFQWIIGMPARLSVSMMMDLVGLR